MAVASGLGGVVRRHFFSNVRRLLEGNEAI